MTIPDRAKATQVDKAQLLARPTAKAITTLRMVDICRALRSLVKHKGSRKDNHKMSLGGLTDGCQFDVDMIHCCYDCAIPVMINMTERMMYYGRRAQGTW